MALDPALVVGRGLGHFDGVMDGRVVDGDDLAIDFNGVRDPHRIFGEHPRENLGNGGFTGSGGAVKEDGAARVEGGAELAEQFRVDDQVAEGALDFVVVHFDVLHALLAGHALT